MAQADDLLQDDTQDEVTKEEHDEHDPLIDLEKETEKEEQVSEPEGMDDPGFSDEENWEEDESKRGREKGLGADDETFGIHTEGDDAASGDSVSLEELRDLENEEDDSKEEESF